MDKLKEIIIHKHKELLAKSKNSFYHALKQNELMVIAEIKRQSPSVGKLASIEDPTSLAKEYEQTGAAAISVLTDQKYFGGSIDDLKAVSHSVSVPVLRKDFIVHPIQIAEAAVAGASAVLLIASVLDRLLPKMVRLVEELGMDALVEVHEKEEISLAIDSGATMIGVNSRNLKTFEVDTTVFEKLIGHLPKNLLKVAESGIKSAEDAHRIRLLGYDAVLIGESLVRSQNRKAFIQAIRGQQ